MSCSSVKIVRRMAPSCQPGDRYSPAMSDAVTVAAVQMAMDADAAANEDRAEGLVRSAAASGAQIVLLPELFTGPYFCIDARPDDLALNDVNQIRFTWQCS